MQIFQVLRKKLRSSCSPELLSVIMRLILLALYEVRTFFVYFYVLRKLWFNLSNNKCVVYIHRYLKQILNH